jgi:hypothetical protein
MKSSTLALVSVAYVITLFAPPLLPSHAPDAGTATETELARFYNEEYGLQQVQAYAHVVGALLFLVLAWGLLGQVGSRAPSDWSGLALVSAGAGAIMMVIGMVIASLGLYFSNVFELRLVEFAYNVGWMMFLRSAPFVALFLFSYAMAARGSARVPRWTSWSAFALAVPGFLSVSVAVWEFGIGLSAMTLMLSGLWFVVASIGIAVRRRTTTAATKAAIGEPAT